MRKFLATLIALTMVLSFVGCSGGPVNQTPKEQPSSTTTKQAKAPESVTISIMLALGQWTDNFDAMIEAYKAENPHIKTIENEFPSSSTYWDLLKSKLASGEMPDIYGCGFGEQIANWTEYLADISDIPAAADLTSDQIAMCSLDGKTIQVLPLVMEGWGILYNMRLLGEVGWKEPPNTISELKQLCEDLKKAGITPFIHHYAETSLSLVNHLGSTWVTVKDNPLEYFQKLKTGQDMDLANDPDLNALLDYYDLVLQYGNEDAIATDKWTGRNSFFLEEAAMVDDEGSWEIPNILNVNPPLAEYVVQGVVPITDDESKNRLQTASICAGVYKESKQLDEAKSFLSWLAKSEPAAKWHQDVMGNIPGLATIKVSENLACLGQDVFKLMQKGLTHETMTPWTPDSVKDSLGEVWSLYVGKQIDRAEFFKQYQKIWTDYAASAK